MQDNINENRLQVRAGDVRRGINLAQQFHITLTAVVGNDLLTNSIYRLLYRSSLILAVHPRSKRTEYGIDEHQTIVDRLKDGDGEGAAAAAAGHLHNTLARARQIEEVTRSDGLAEILARHAAAGAAPAKAVKRVPRRSAP